jgi:chaperonin GroES
MELPTVDRASRISQIKPTGNRVLVKLLRRTASDRGLLYPGAWIDDEKQWLVLAVGSGIRLKDGTRLTPEVRVGDHIIVDALGKDRYDLDDRTGRMFIDATEIVAVVGGR